MGMLHTLQLENFKSYKGTQVIGPFYRFTAIIGPNGSGKSNLMDAICFVLGEKANNLRVRKLSELIHGAPIGKPVSNRCTVTMNYQDDDGKMRKFSRSVYGSTSEYKVDDKLVTPQQYNMEMENIQIFIKAKNFLVYQGQIEQVAMKNPKERTALFEEISRSCEFQAEYDRLKVELQKAEDDTQQNMNKRRGIAQEKKEAKMEKDEAEKYQHMKDELEDKEKKMYMFELFHCERIANELQEELDSKKEGVNALIKRKEEWDEVVGTKQRLHKKAAREFHKLDKEVQDKDKEVADKRPCFVQAKQEVLHMKGKLEAVKKSQNAAQKMADQNAEQQAKWKKQIKELEEEKAKEELDLQTQSQQLDLNLSPEQISEYQRLKAEAAKKSGILDQQLASLRMELDTEKSALQHDKRRLVQWEEKIKHKEKEIERQKKQAENLEEQYQQQQSLLQDEKANIVHLERQVKESRDKLEKVNDELEDVVKQLADAHGETAESERMRRRQEAIDNLRRVFPDKVFGRLVDLCQPSHKRFTIAITKVLFKHMTSIVCDTEETAREAIVYLKEQRYPPETFLPQSSLDVHPINEKLRELREPAGVKLVYDVIQCNNSAAKKALQYACGSALICETPEDARYLAYGSSGTGERYKAVALDGTLFQQSGVISGGGADLKQKAKKWDENAMKKLKERRNALLEESNTLQRTRRRELELDQKRIQIQALSKRIEYTAKDKTRAENESSQKLETELEILKGEYSVIPPKIEEIELRIANKTKGLEAKEVQCNAVADEVFADFCQQLGIKDIRVYEERELRFHEEKEQRLKDFDVRLDRMQNELEYFKSEDRSQRAKVEQEKLKRLQKELEGLVKREAKEGRVLEQLETELEQLKMKVLEKKVEVDRCEGEVATAKKDLQAASREVTQAEKALLSLEASLGRRIHERHSLLHSAKINQIKLPLVQGSLADIDAEDMDETDETAGPSTLSQEQIDRERKIKLNYKDLSAEMKKVDDEDEVRRTVERMTKEIAEVQNVLGRLNAPNLRAQQRMDAVKEKEAETVGEFEHARKKARKIRTHFEKIKTERYRRFQECFEPVSQKIDEIYKALSRNQSAQAFLGADNMEEPYLEGIAYNCVAPGKRFRPMDNLSGGEKTVAALALLFAVHARNPSPFFVLDEVDAALDNTNIGKVASFICETARNDMQLIVISLKEEFYNKADALVGIYPQPANCTVSGVLTFDLSKFKVAGGADANVTQNTTVLMEA